MNYHDLSRLTLKLLGLFIIASALASVPLSILALQVQTFHLTWPILLLHYVLPLAIVLLIGLILFRADNKITNAVITEADADELASGIDYTRVEAILISLLGFYLVAEALPYVVIVIGQYVALYSASGPTTTPSLSMIANELISLVIGAGLILSSRGLAVWRHRFLGLRTAGRNLEPDK